MSGSLPHSRCFNVATRRRIGPRQATLVVKDGVLSVGPPAPSKRKPRPKHTPAPHVVRRMANTPTYSTSDPAQSSFLRLPPEIRILVYRLLLSYSEAGPLAYTVCVVNARLVAVATNIISSSTYRVNRHDLFPAILMCCRTTYREGAPVLYGENRFLVDCQKEGWERIINSWPLGVHQMEAMTNLSMPIDQFLASNIARFPLLKRLYIDGPISVQELATTNLEMLRNVPKVYIRITVPYHEIARVHQLYMLGAAGDWPEVVAKARHTCLQEYLSAFAAAWGRQAAGWEFDFGPDGYQYGTEWDMEIHVN